ncbi:MAG TPA: 4-hydroxythreonine-4-phosphate dehydrogenase PdxA [Stellaceae bacterium]|nr:4-hydroxythreonine-4-phosphate dehydrogenase PdxA [Stellaceae bacterium]
MTPSTAPLALTIGEPAGVGGEITLKAWRARNSEHLPPFFVLDVPERLTQLAAALKLDVPIREIAAPEDANAIFPTALPVLPIALPNPVVAGKLDTGNAPAVIGAIARAVELVQQGRAGAIVTNPIQKETLYAAGFKHPGHTEYLAELAGGVTPVMMLVGPELRVVPVTIHTALRAAVASLKTEDIVTAGKITAAGLKRDFGIAKPRLAVAGLNPHAGENGTIGREDIEIVAPAVAALRAAGIDVTGPLAPDTMFHAAARQRYDVAICMYHDQALIPLKTLDFDRGVNITLGLPFIRTSPDHGTALDIAGKGVANPASLIAALALAGELVQRRVAAPIPA